MKLLKNYLIGNVKRMNDNNVRMAYIGRTYDLPQEVQDTMQWAMESTAKNTGTTLTLALNYGARSEIVDAVRRILTDLTTEAHTRGCAVEDLLGAGALDSLDESTISRALYAANMPDPDLIVRTSGEQRISNFLLWQIAYSEIYITDRLWPDFRGIHLLEAIADYQRRDRRFGGLSENSDEKIDTLQPVSELETEIATRAASSARTHSPLASEIVSRLPLQLLDKLTQRRTNLRKHRVVTPHQSHFTEKLEPHAERGCRSCIQRQLSLKPLHDGENVVMIRGVEAEALAMDRFAPGIAQLLHRDTITIRVHPILSICFAAASMMSVTA